MDYTQTVNLTAFDSIEIQKTTDNEVMVRYFAKLVNIHIGDDKQNPLWKLELIGEGVYSLTYQQHLLNELVSFGSFEECLKRIHRDAMKIVKSREVSEQ